MNATPSRPAEIDAFLAGLTQEIREALEKPASPDPFSLATTG